MKSVIIFFLLISQILFSQRKENALSGYVMSSFTYKHDKNWFGFLEFQGRSIREFQQPDYYEVKGGIGYQLNPSHQVLIGIGKYGTYKEEEIHQAELRLWLQYVFFQKFGVLKVDHRVRLEKRFFTYYPSLSSANAERFRYKLNFTIPIFKEKLESNTFFVSSYEELFFSLDKFTFSRNRLYLGAGYRFNRHITSQLGSLWQKDFATTGNTNLYYLYLGFQFTFYGKKNN